MAYTLSSQSVFFDGICMSEVIYNEANYEKILKVLELLLA
jgi:hypothetical protein